jgi:membrane protease YdiL (CAAX protease family)
MDVRTQAQTNTISFSPDPLFDGSWERSGRSLNTAALVGLLGIGAIFFNAESIIALLAIGVKHALSTAPEVTGGFLDKLAASMRFYSTPLRVAVLISEFAFMLVPSLWLVKRWHSSNVLGYIRLKKAPIIEVSIAILVTLAMIPSCDLVADRLVHLLPVPKRLVEINAEVFTARTGLEFGWIVIVVCLTPAICEEIFFRGFIQRTFERTMQWKSVILIGVLFGLFHFQPLGLMTLSILGILFGYFYYRSRSLLPSMAAHFTNNLVAIAVLYRPGGTPGIDAPERSLLPLWMVGATFVAGVSLLVLYHVVTARRYSVVVQDTSVIR